MYGVRRASPVSADVLFSGTREREEHIYIVRNHISEG